MGIPKPLVQANQLFIVITVLLGLFFSYWILFIPFINGLLTLVTKQNAVMKLGLPFLKKAPNQYIQEDKAQQFFNQWITTICLGLSTLFFYIGYHGLAYFFSIIVVLAAGIALLGFCIGCAIRYRYLMWNHKRASKSNQD